MSRTAALNDFLAIGLSAYVDPDAHWAADDLAVRDSFRAQRKALRKARDITGFDRDRKRGTERAAATRLVTKLTREMDAVTAAELAHRAQVLARMAA